MEISPIFAVPIVTADKAVVSRVYQGDDSGKKVSEAVYETTIYDRLGVVQGSTRSHTIEYKI